MTLKQWIIGMPLSAVMVCSAHATAENANTQLAVPHPTTPALTTETQRLSYTFGVDLGKNFKRQGVKIDPTALIQGLTDASQGKPTQLSREEMMKTLQKFRQKMMSERDLRFKQQAELNRHEGEAFLAENQSKEGVTTTKTGLQYKVLQKGKGRIPRASDTVVVEYEGRLINGTIFDSTKKYGKPATFGVKQVIPGWTEALQLMNEGSEWEIYVPAKLAYGERGVGAPIGPNQALIFKIHLISVKNANPTGR